MKYSLLLLTVALIDFSLNVSGLPVPVGQIIKYRVPSKYFNQAGTSTTLSTAEGSNSLYDFLLHKHFGDEDKLKHESSATVTTEESTTSVEEAEEVSSTMKNMQDFDEVI